MAPNPPPKDPIITPAPIKALPATPPSPAPLTLNPPRHISPEERLKRRQSAQRRHLLEEQDALREEQARIARRMQETEEQSRREAEEEQRRVALLEQHIQHAAARRRREEHEAKEAERRRMEEIRMRKVSEKQRRLKYTKEMEKWRSDYIARVASQSSEIDEERRRDAEERRSRVRQLSEIILDVPSVATTALCGWLTIQPHDAIDWKRRYFIFDLEHAQLTLCKNQRDLTRTIELVDLDGRIASFHEWYDGFEELEAIPHSFAVTFVDGRTWRIYADTEDDKDRLLVLLGEAAGFIL